MWVAQGLVCCSYLHTRVMVPRVYAVLQLEFSCCLLRVLILLIKCLFGAFLLFFEIIIQVVGKYFQKFIFKGFFFFFWKTVFIERTVHLQCRLFVKCRWILPVSNIIANFLKKYLYVFTWLHCVLAVACRICSSGMWDLVPWPGIKGPLHLGARSLSHWTTREVPIANILNTISGHENLLAVISVHLMSRVSWDLWVL